MKIEIDCTETECNEIIRDLPPGGIASGHLEAFATNETPINSDSVVTVVIHINVTLDLTRVAVLAFASWLVRKAIAVRGCRHVKVDGHYFPVNKADTPKLIADKIQHEQEKQQKA